MGIMSQQRRSIVHSTFAVLILLYECIARRASIRQSLGALFIASSLSLAPLNSIIGLSMYPQWTNQIPEFESLGTIVYVLTILTLTYSFIMLFTYSKISIVQRIVFFFLGLVFLPIYMTVALVLFLYALVTSQGNYEYVTTDTISHY
jgi:hypothetical protein